MVLKIGRNRNGLKVLRISFPGTGIRGFSIQTNGNLPVTHTTNTPRISEVASYLAEHGTKRQRQAFRHLGDTI
jgi:hypothetical protein